MMTKDQQVNAIESVIDAVKAELDALTKIDDATPDQGTVASGPVPDPKQDLHDEMTTKQGLLDVLDQALDYISE